MTIGQYARTAWIWLFGRSDRSSAAQGKKRAQSMVSHDREEVEEERKRPKLVLPREPAPDEAVEVRGMVVEIVPNDYKPPQEVGIKRGWYNLPSADGADHWRWCGLTRHKESIWALVALSAGDVWWKSRPLEQWMEKRGRTLTIRYQLMDEHTLCIENPPAGDGPGHWRPALPR